MKPAPFGTQAACEETTRWLLVGTDDAGVQARAQRHLGHCPACQHHQSHLEQTRADVQTMAPPLDDVRRARMLARVTPALDEIAARTAVGGGPGQPVPRRIRAALGSFALAGRRVRAPLLGALAATAVAAAGWFVVSDRSAPRGPFVAGDARGQVAAVLPAATPSAAPRPRDLPSRAAPAAARDVEPARLEPFRVTSRTRQQPTAHWVGQRFEKLDVPAGTTLRARLGRQARVSLIGPARVQVLSSVAGVIDVRLDAGRLIADYDHNAGGRLRIFSPDGVTEVIGTLFSVAVDRAAGRSQVAVARGRVMVASRGGVTQTLVAGQTWGIGQATTRPLPAPARHLLLQHERAVLDPNPIAPARAAGPRPSRRALRASTKLAMTATTTTTATTTATTRPQASPATRVAAAPPQMAPAAIAPLPAPSTEPPHPTAEALYQSAEADMRRRDWRSAEQRLSQILATASAAPLEDVARYELAQLALRRGDRARAQRHIDDLLRSNREPALREPAAYLRCEMQAEAGDADQARVCLTAFRQQHPASAHDRGALGWLVRLSPRAADCTTGRGFLDEYLRRYPGGPDATAASQRRARCP